MGPAPSHMGHYNSGSDCNSGDCGIYNSGSDCYSGNCGMQCQPQQQCCQMQMPCQQMVQPMVQPTVASQPRPSIAYSYGYPSTVTYGLSLPTVSPTYTWGGYPGLYGAGFLGGKAGAYGDVNTGAAPFGGPGPVPPMGPMGGPPMGMGGPPMGYAPQAPGYAPGMGAGLPGVGYGSYGGYGIGGYGGVKADGGFLMSAVKK